MDKWGVEFAVTGSQKGIILPPGWAIVGFSDKAMKAAETSKLPRTFFDVREVANGYPNNAFAYFPPVGLMNDLKLSLEMIQAEGLENVFAHGHRIAEGVRLAVAGFGG